MSWRPISEEAKRHGDRVLLFVPKTNKGVVIGRWQSRLVTHRFPVTGWWLEGYDLCFNADPYLPTHWQPMPEFPDVNKN